MNIPREGTEVELELFNRQRVNGCRWLGRMSIVHFAAQDFQLLYAAEKNPLMFEQSNSEFYNLGQYGKSAV